jgi:hypothetical protein
VRARGSLRLLDQLDLVGRNCELAKLFGIQVSGSGTATVIQSKSSSKISFLQFFEVLSRGSQFRVESLMLRHTKRRNSIPVSPNVQVRPLF